MKSTVWRAACLVALWPMACIGAETVSPGQRYEGTGRVSAAVAISPDMFVTSSGQDNVLRVYRTAGPAAPLARLDVSGFLGLDDEPADIQGGARIADRVYWITSHSRNEEGHFEPRRYRFFATRIRVKDGTVSMEPVGKPCTTLLDKLPDLNTVNTLRLDKALRLSEQLSERQRRRLAPAKEGLRIEALCADPRVDILFLGFRNPRPVRVMTGRPHALVVPLNNAADVAEKGRNPIFGEAMLWDFDGLGITGFEYSPAHGLYYIVAQPNNDDRPCVLYRWSGMKAISPELLWRFRSGGETPRAVALGPFGTADTLSLLTGRGDSVDAERQERHFQSIWIQP